MNWLTDHWWGAAILWLLIFFVLLPLRSGMTPAAWFKQVREFNPVTKGLLWFFFLFILVVAGAAAIMRELDLPPE